MHLRPDEAITPDDLARGKSALVQDAAWASLAGALFGGVILVGFAVELGASPLVIGLLAAIPYLAQLAQLPAIALVERIRQRRKITVLAVTGARALILSLALIPFLPERRLQLEALVAAHFAITILGSIAGCSLNSWLHQLIPQEGIGSFFARRLFWSTTVSSVGAFAAGVLVDNWPFGEKLHAYSIAFLAAGISGFISSAFLARVPEPRMHQVGMPSPVLAKLQAPFRDANFRSLIVFMAAWNAVSNLAAPFLTVYLLTQLGYPLSTVTTLWIASQLSSALTLHLWGRLSDHLSNKAILAVALPAYFACLLGFVFTALPTKHELTLPLLYVFHVVMGAAAGGIGLATGNIALKLSPAGKGTAYLASVSLAGSFAGGISPLIGGALADWFSARELALNVRWASPGKISDVLVLQLEHWEFLFAVSAALGLYVLHRLWMIREGEEISERVVLQRFVMEALRTLDQLSPIEGLRVVMMFPFGRLVERRRAARPPPSEAPPKAPPRDGR
jgi:MFS family permease